MIFSHNIFFGISVLAVGIVDVNVTNRVCSPCSDNDFVVVRHDTEISDPLRFLSTTLFRCLK